MENREHGFFEKDLVKENIKLSPISRSSVTTYMGKITEAVEMQISKDFPDAFGLILDGWTFSGTHFYGLFANYETDQGKPPLLAFAPLLDETCFNAANIKDFIGATLQIYDKTWDQVKFLVMDNEATNQKLAKDLGINMVGCASHRLNLAAKQWIKQNGHEDLLEKINALMQKLSTLKQAGELRRKTDIRPVLLNVTRRSSTFAMLKIYREIKEFINKSDPYLAEVIPTALEDLMIDKVYENMVDLESVTKKLQDDSLTLSDSRALLNGLLSKYPTMRSHIAEDSQIVLSGEFEMAVVRANDGAHTEADQTLLRNLDLIKNDNLSEDGASTSTSFADSLLEAKRQKLSKGLILVIWNGSSLLLTSWKD